MDLNCMQILTNIIIKSIERQKQKVKYWAMMIELNWISFIDL